MCVAIPQINKEARIFGFRRELPESLGFVKGKDKDFLDIFAERFNLSNDKGSLCVLLNEEATKRENFGNKYADVVFRNEKER